MVRAKHRLLPSLLLFLCLLRLLLSLSPFTEASTSRPTTSRRQGDGLLSLVSCNRSIRRLWWVD